MSLDNQHTAIAVALIDHDCPGFICTLPAADVEIDAHASAYHYAVDKKIWGFGMMHRIQVNPEVVL